MLKRTKGHSHEAQNTGSDSRRGETIPDGVGEILVGNTNPDLRKAVRAFETDVLTRTGFRMDGENRIALGLSGRPDEWRISAGSGVSVTGGCYLSLIEALDNLTTLSDKLTADKPLTGNYTGEIPLALGEYTLVWNDEFDSDYTEKWTTFDHTYEGHEGGKAYRVKKDSTLWQEDGKLMLSAYRLEGHDYECAPYVWTKKKMLFNHGIVEMHGKLAAGKGLWSSFWMTGDVTFPEIDADAKLPVNYTVDWVRLYQKSGEGIRFFD